MPQQSSMSVMVDAAHKHKILVNNDLKIIPELTQFAQRGTDYFFPIAKDAMGKAMRDSNPGFGIAVMQRICLYMFAKGIEAVMLWRDAPDGRISIEFKQNELATMEITTDLNPDRRKVVNDSAGLALPIFSAHNEFVSDSCRRGRGAADWVEGQMKEAINWSMLLGIAYAVEQGYGF